MAKGFIDIVLDALFKSIFTADWIGRRGEKLTVRWLKTLNFFGRKGQILRNLYVPKDNGETSEIDVIYICQKGIYVLESKNYSGWVFGDEKSAYWTVMLPNKQKNRLYNPILQNQTHIKWLRAYIGENIPLFSIIVFSERCELKKVEATSVPVVKRDFLYGTIKRMWDASPDVLSETEVIALFEKLKKLTNAETATKEAHIRNIEEKYAKKEKPKEDKNQEPIAELQPSAGEWICPRCGGQLILRTVKKGENAGKQFFGCGNFPKCRYTQEIKE